MFLHDVKCLCFFSSVPGKLRQFVLDLHSGKLHREFHHGPDPTDSTPGQEETGEVASSPPESSFQKLAPSETRYTILSRDRDELWPQRPSSDPVTQCHAPGSGRGLGLGQASGTEQQHPTPLLKSERCRGGEWRGRRRKRRTGGEQKSAVHNANMLE